MEITISEIDILYVGVFIGIVFLIRWVYHWIKFRRDDYVPPSLPGVCATCDETITGEPYYVKFDEHEIEVCDDCAAVLNGVADTYEESRHQSI